MLLGNWTPLKYHASRTPSFSHSSANSTVKKPVKFCDHGLQQWSSAQKVNVSCEAADGGLVPATSQKTTSVKKKSEEKSKAGRKKKLKEVEPSFETTSAHNGNSDPSHLELTAHVLTIPVGNRVLTLETGRIGRQANGAVMVRDGDTMVYATVCAEDEASGTSTPPNDFLPLSVHYQERFSAAGRTSGGYFKREGRPRDHEVLVARLVDRPIRPMIAKGFMQETQILLWLLSYDGIHSSDALSITAAGASLALSDVPLAKPVAGVRVGLVDGEYVVNPTQAQMQGSELDMVVAGTRDAVLMIEGYCNLLSEAQLLEAVQKGQEAITVICDHLAGWAERVGKPKMVPSGSPTPPELKEEVKRLVGPALSSALRVRSKQQRGNAVFSLEEELLQALTEEGWQRRGQNLEQADEEVLEDVPEWEATDVDEIVIVDDIKDEAVEAVEAKHKAMAALLTKSSRETKKEKKSRQKFYDPRLVKQAFKQISSLEMRRLVVQEGERSDGRGPRDIRPIAASCGLLPRVHGSALFTRGETQAIAVTTLGGDSMAQKLDNVTSKEGELKRFYLQYSFPPCSVGEVGRVGGQGRREIGHGTLAERALEPILPDPSKFPYTVRVESTVTESNGSSSMATVCGGCLSLQDAGVPIKTAVAGVAMGLILNTLECGGDGEPVILSDILGSEDALGDMDFKVAGSEDGVTAFQMDIKVEGITIIVMEKALAQAKEGRRHILKQMARSNPPPSKALANHAPRIDTIRVAREKVKEVIGSGGKVIRSIIEESGVDNVEINDEGVVNIISRDGVSAQKARAMIESIAKVPAVGNVYRGCLVKSVVSFGAFIEIGKGKEALCHISEIAIERTEKVEDVIKEGDRVDVKLIEINQRGQLKVSRKAVLVQDKNAITENNNNGLVTAE